MRREEGSPVCGLGLTNHDVILSNLLVAAPRPPVQQHQQTKSVILAHYQMLMVANLNV